MISTVTYGCIHDGCTALYLDCGHSLVIHSEVGAPEDGAEVDCTTCDGPARARDGVVSQVLSRPAVRELGHRIRTLSPVDRLRLAADLLERGHIETAHVIAEIVVAELGAIIAHRARLR